MKKFISFLVLGLLLLSTPVLAHPPAHLGPHSDIVPYDSTHNIYSNHDFGFSMVLPKEVAGLNYCHNRQNPTMIPLTVFEDGNGTVYIGAAYRYENDANGNCTKVDHTLAYFSNSQGGPDPDIYWELHANKDVDNLQKLTQLIKGVYGKSCTIHSLTPTQQTGVFEARIQSDGKDVEHTRCPINFGYKLFYNSPKSTVVTWILGQTVMFTDSTETKAYDLEMANSFRFL